MDTLFYDGNCSLCVKEMNKLEVLKDDTLTLTNINEMEISDSEKSKLFNRLHLQTDEGTMMTGFAANIRAWQHTKFRRYLWACTFPPLSWLGELGYRIWLKYYHYQKSRIDSSCSDENCRF